MQTADAIEETAPLDDAEYHTLEQTLMESQRGRRFLKQFLTRNKTPETQEILSAVLRLEKSMTRQRSVPNLDQIRLDIAEMHDAIERTKNEIAHIKAEGDESNRFLDASHELDLIVTQTEGATQTILEAAEKIQEQAWILREAGAAEDVCDEIDAKSTEIFMACSFQDLTGQRTNKVVQVLRYLESRINMMINIWGIEETEASTDMAPADLRPDAHLLNGPQKTGEGVSQDNVDALLDEASFETASKVERSETIDADFDFDALDVGEIDEPAAEPQVLDADDIDKLFDTAASATDDAEDQQDVADAVSNEEDVPEFAAAEPEVAASEDQDGDAVLDEDAIDKLFEQEAEAAADTDWEDAEKATDEEDPLENLSESERQALFN